ncbi:MAG TPA: TIGR02147 family protein, partial [Bdellovibrionales bacterium]|nr:TIGR02147 family protein [Bdellovibrionales bacterium]
MSMGGHAFKKSDGQEHARPDIFVYKDYKTFLRDYLHYLKLSDAGFSIRKLAVAAGVSIGYVTTILKPDHDVTPKSVEKLLPHLRLDRAESAYFRILSSITSSSTQDE